MKELEGKKRKTVENSLRKSYGVRKLPHGLVMVKQRLRYMNKETLKFLKQMKAIRSVGIAVSGEELDVLTIEGSRLFKGELRERVLEFERQEAELWLAGGELEVDLPDGLVVARFKENYLGSGVVSNGKARADIPKWRLIRVSASE